MKLKLQYFGHLIRRADSLEKTLMLGKIEGRRRRGQQRMDGWMASRTQWTRVWVDSGSWWWTGRPGLLCFMGSQRVGHDWVTELNWEWLVIKCDSHYSFCLFVLAATFRFLVPWPGIEAVLPTAEAQSLNHRTTREIPVPHYSKSRQLNGVIN